MRIAARIQEAYIKGELPRRDDVTFAYMWSAHQHLGPGIGAWHPHLMVFAPYLQKTQWSEAISSAVHSRRFPMMLEPRYRCGYPSG